MQKGSDFTAASLNPLLKFIIDKKYRWLRHVLFILVGLVLAFKGDIGVSTELRTPEVIRVTLLVDALSFAFILAMLYFMMLVVVPKLLFRSRFFLFAVAFLLMVTLTYFVVWYLDHTFLKPADTTGSMNMQHIEFSFVHFVQIGLVCAVLMASVIGMVVFKKWIGDVQRMNELQQANLKTELEQLKSQVNPHFLFNTLNNLLVLTKTDADKAAQVLLGLSDLLRYQLYDSTREQILLSKDIAFIHNLLSLEKIRKDDFVYEIHTEGKVDGISLPPFLFIPFVENAIKHGASTVGHSYLKLDFRITGDTLYFQSQNSKPKVKHNLPGGIGLKNIVRRLELLFPARHTLRITDNTDTYIVNLTLPLL